ncbi:hypothetical protein IKG20_00230 [Candidatus Saccharibacteria bacterium]|nr:hypothetical protein [Candidatus Saccharibacteria bacterium]
METEANAPKTVTSPEEKMDEVAGTKPKKHLSKKAKLAIIISAIVLGVIAIALVLILIVFKKTEPEVVLTDLDILTAHAWEKEGAETVIWTLNRDGTGEITTNKSNYYDMKWTIEQGEETQTLKVDTAWLYELNDSFSFSLDREADSFTVKNLADETESVFVPLGTAEKKAAEQTETSDDPVEKTEE